MIRTLSLLFLSTPALAVDGPERHVLPPALVDADCVVLAPTSGTAAVLLPEGMVERPVAVVLVGERVAAVGEELGGLSLSGGGARWQGLACALVDTSGKVVTPGFIEASSQLGLVEVSMEGATRHANDEGGAFGAGFRVADSYDPHSTLIPVARVEGVTGAILTPSGGRFAGTGGFVHLAGATQDAAVVDPQVAIYTGLGGPSAAGALADIRRALRDAVTLSRNRAAYERGDLRELVAPAEDLEALLPVISGELPLVVGVNRAADIEALLRLKRELDRELRGKLRLVIQGGAEAWRHADALAEAGVAVIVDPTVYGPGAFDQMQGRPDNPALLAQAGVDVIIATGSSHNARLVRQHAGNAVRGGMDGDAALGAITRVPAQVFGQPDEGVLRPGAVANVVVWGGDPLETTTSAEHVFIDGQAVALDSRQWRLFLKYRTLPGTPAAPLALPE